MPILLLIGGGIVATIVVLSFLKRSEREVGLNPDLPGPPSPYLTGYKYVNAMLEELKKASQTSGIPLGLLVGWVARESRGYLNRVPSKMLKGEADYERGYFQLTPTESKGLGLDHARLSTDPTYSINAGLALIGKYMGLVDKLQVAPGGTSYYWRLVKLAHGMGSGAVRILVNGAKAVGEAQSWETFRKHAIDNDATYLPRVKHSTAKWIPHADKVFDIGRPFGFGTDVPAII